MMRYMRAVLVIAILMTGGYASSAMAGELPAFVLEIRTTSGVHTFQVEVAADRQARRTGLMFRKTLGRNEGMLFVYAKAALISMWMKNTFIPLDMLFIDQQGDVVRIAENTEPHSLTPISSGYPVTMVLEVPGGTVERLGIQISDHISYKPPR